MTDPRLLLLAPNWLGDVVMATPLLDFLSRSLQPAAGRLTLGVRPAWADLFATDPRLAGIFAVERTGRHGGVRGNLNLARDLAREGFDGVVICPPSLRMGLAARMAGLPLRVGYATDFRGPLLSHALTLPKRGDRHHSLELLDLGRTALTALDLTAVDGPEPRTGTLPAPALPAGLPGLDPTAADGPPLWVLGTGATYGSAKTWPRVRVVQLVRRIRERGPARVVLLGDAEAGGFARDLATDLGLVSRHDLAGPDGLVDLTGRTDLLQVAAILAAAHAFVGNDSGLMHLAGALGVPTVGVFGSSNPRWTAPLGPRAGYVVVDGFDCHPCYRKTCNQPRFCLETVTEAAVLDTLDALIAIPVEEAPR